MGDKEKFQQNVHFNAITPEGRLVECETLFTFENTENGKSYIVYTDNQVDEEGNINVYASIYHPSEVEYSEESNMAAISLIAIETEEEWVLVEQLLNEAQGMDGE